MHEQKICCPETITIILCILLVESVTASRSRSYSSYRSNRRYRSYSGYSKHYSADGKDYLAGRIVGGIIGGIIGLCLLFSCCGYCYQYFILDKNNKTHTDVAKAETLQAENPNQPENTAIKENDPDNLENKVMEDNNLDKIQLADNKTSNKSYIVPCGPPPSYYALQANRSENIDTKSRSNLVDNELYM